MTRLSCHFPIIEQRKRASGEKFLPASELNGTTGPHTVSSCSRMIRTQVLEGSSQSDVTVEDVESLSREPKRSKTVHVVGHCQKLCQQLVKLTGTTPVVYFTSTFDRTLMLRGWGTVNKLLPTNCPDREKT
jgi:hypothetical protein